MRKRLEEPDFQAEFKIRLKTLREKKFKKGGKKWGQADMAEALGILKNTYSKYEQLSSPNNFPMYLMPALCEALERDPWDVLTGESEAQSPGRRKGGS